MYFVFFVFNIIYIMHDYCVVFVSLSILRWDIYIYVPAGESLLCFLSFFLALLLDSSGLAFLFLEPPVPVETASSSSLTTSSSPSDLLLSSYFNFLAGSASPSSS